MDARSRDMTRGRACLEGPRERSSCRTWNPEGLRGASEDRVETAFSPTLARVLDLWMTERVMGRLGEGGGREEDCSS